MWTFIIPYTILSLPIILMDRKDSEHRTTGERAGMGFIVWFILFMLGCMLSWVGLIWKNPEKDTFFEFTITLGFIGWVIAIFVGGIELFKVLKEKWENRGIKYDENGWRICAQPKEQEPSIIKEFIKASYNKYCPRIEWTRNDNK